MTNGESADCYDKSLYYERGAKIQITSLQCNGRLLLSRHEQTRVNQFERMSLPHDQETSFWFIQLKSRMILL